MFSMLMRKEKIEGTRHVTEYAYPPEVLREVVVNAVAHRELHVVSERH